MKPVKPVVDITEANGAKWTMGKLVADALGEGSGEQNRFLDEFNDVAVNGGTDDVINCLLRWANLVLDGDVISSSDASIEEQAEALAVPDDPKQLRTGATEYLAAVKGVSVADVDDYADVIGFLADVKEMLSTIETKRKELTKGARETVSKINAEFKPAEDAYKKAEAILKDKLVQFRYQRAAERNLALKEGREPDEPVPELPGVSVREQRVVLEVDIDALPDEYKQPNMKAIEKAIKAGKEVPGVLWATRDSLAITHGEVER